MPNTPGPIVLSNKDFEAFMQELENPSPPNEKLKLLFVAYKKYHTENIISVCPKRGDQPLQTLDEGVSHE